MGAEGHASLPARAGPWQEGSPVQGKGWHCPLGKSRTLAQTQIHMQIQTHRPTCAQTCTQAHVQPHTKRVTLMHTDLEGTQKHTHTFQALPLPSAAGHTHGGRSFFQEKVSWRVGGGKCE